MSDYLLRATAFAGTVRGYAIESTELVDEARRRQGTSATASAALGRTITISAMMGTMLKGDDTLTVKVEGGGPIGAIVVDANADGDVRGYVSNPKVDFESNEQGKLDVKRAVGTSGNLSVIKDLGLKDYFTGQVPMVSGEISEDFTYYFASSEQIPSAVGAGVLVNPDLTISAAGGFIIQIMPGASDEVVEFVEKQLEQVPSISALIQQGKTPEEILEKILGKDDLKILSRQPVHYKCRCSKDRLEQALLGIGEEEIQKMIEEDHGAEATCHFCNETYYFTEEELKELTSNH